MAGDPRQAETLDWTYKGIGPSMTGLRPAELESPRRLFDDHLLMPVATLKQSVLRANSAWMRAFLAGTGAKIAPHGKTTMAPELFRLQLEDGAWGITAATVHHVRAYRQFGVDRILMANQLVGAAGIDWVLEEMRRSPDFDFYCLVDSIENVEVLEAAAKRVSCGRPLQVLIEAGAVNGRAGVRTVEAGVKVALRTAAAYPFLQLVGIETFEGVFQRSANAEAKAREVLGRLVEIAMECERQGLFKDRFIVTAGGSGYFDLAARILADGAFSRTPEIVLRSGCYLTHDDGMYAELYAQLLQRSPSLQAGGVGLRPALQVWGQILSRPEPGRAICGVGKRDIGHDADPPILSAWARPHDSTSRSVPPGCVVAGLNDQHAFIDGPTDMPFQVGDFVAFGMSHPCTTFDKWRVLLTIDDEYRILGAVRTYF